MWAQASLYPRLGGIWSLIGTVRCPRPGHWPGLPQGKPVFAVCNIAEQSQGPINDSQKPRLRLLRGDLGLFRGGICFEFAPLG